MNTAGTRKYYHGNELLLADQPYHDNFLQFMTAILRWSRVFGVVYTGSTLWLLWGICLMALLLAVECGALWKVIRALAGWSADTANQRSVTARLAGAMFYAASLISQILCWRLSYRWQSLSKYWASIEWVVSIKNIPPDPTLRRRLIVVTVFISIGTVVEHLMSILTAIGFNCPIEDFLRTYILKSHGFLLLESEYYRIIALPVFFISNIATILWNFQYLIIILISMGLTSRYHRLNKCVATTCMKLSREKKWSKVHR